MIHGINGRLPLFFVGLAEAVLDVHSAHTNFAAKKTSAATAGWIEYPQLYKRKLYVKGANRMVLPGMSVGEKKDRPHGRFDRYRLGRVNNGLSDTPLLPGGEAWGIKGAISYKRMGTGYKRRMRHTASMRDCEVPHGNISCGQTPYRSLPSVTPLY